MRRQGNDMFVGVETALRELVRDVRPGYSAGPHLPRSQRGLDAFVAASEDRLALHRGPTVPPPSSLETRDGSPGEDHEVT